MEKQETNLEKNNQLIQKEKRNNQLDKIFLFETEIPSINFLMDIEIDTDNCLTILRILFYNYHEIKEQLVAEFLFFPKGERSWEQ